MSSAGAASCFHQEWMWQCMGLLEKHQPQPAAANREGDGEEVVSTGPGGGASSNGGGGRGPETVLCSRSHSSTSDGTVKSWG